LYLARSEVHRILATSLGLGSRLPAYCTTIGRVMLAQLPAQALERYFETVELAHYTEFTETSPARLREIMAGVRDQGYAVVDQELGLNVRAIGVPVRAASGRTCAGLNVSVKSPRIPLARFSSEFLAPMQAAAEKLGQFLVLSKTRRGACRRVLRWPAGR